MAEPGAAAQPSADIGPRSIAPRATASTGRCGPSSWSLLLSV